LKSANGVTILEKNRKLKEILRFKILYISLVPVLKLTLIILIIMEQNMTNLRKTSRNETEECASVVSFQNVIAYNFIILEC
jgi:hypothetical protein